MNLSNQIHPTEQETDGFHCLACGLFFAPGLLSDGDLCAVCDSLSVDYTDDEIINAFVDWRRYQKPQMKRIEKPRQSRRQEQQWGKRRNWGHGRRG